MLYKYYVNNSVKYYVNNSVQPNDDHGVNEEYCTYLKMAYDMKYL